MGRMIRWTEEDLAALKARRSRVAATSLSGVKSKRVAVRRDYKAELVQILTLRGIQVEPEFKIFEKRRFRADWRVLATKVLIEYEGGIFHKGKQGHDSVKGILRDVEKGNLCAIAGWIVIRVCPNHIDSGEALAWVESAIEKSSNGVD